MSEVEFEWHFNQSRPFHNSMDTTKSIIGHENVSKKTLYVSTTINSYVTR